MGKVRYFLQKIVIRSNGRGIGYGLEISKGNPRGRPGRHVPTLCKKNKRRCSPESRLSNEGLCLGIVSTHLYMLFLYAVKRTSKWHRIFFSTRELVEICKRADKTVALQPTVSLPVKVRAPTYDVEVLPRHCRWINHKHNPARKRCS